MLTSTRTLTAVRRLMAKMEGRKLNEFGLDLWYTLSQIEGELAEWESVQSSTPVRPAAAVAPVTEVTPVPSWDTEAVTAILGMIQHPTTNEVLLMGVLKVINGAAVKRGAPPAEGN